jgi:hypothetical protein
MNDIYLMNKATGELSPSKQVFRDFYKTHGIFDSVFDEWQETDIEVEDEYIDFPDFAKAII